MKPIHLPCQSFLHPALPWKCIFKCTIASSWHHDIPSYGAPTIPVTIEEKSWRDRSISGWISIHVQSRVAVVAFSSSIGPIHHLDKIEQCDLDAVQDPYRPGSSKDFEEAQGALCTSQYGQSLI
ncbi:hypothetical protein Tco_0644791 [Tanacetum coccineum]